MKQVYLMKCADFYKIGISTNPKARAKDLQTSNPLKVELIATKYTRKASKYESQLHSTYSGKRVRGEWFRLSSKDLSDLKKSGFDFDLISSAKDNFNYILGILTKRYGVGVKDFFPRYKAQGKRCALSLLVSDKVFYVYKSEILNWLNGTYFKNVTDLHKSVCSVSYFICTRYHHSGFASFLKVYFKDFKNAAKFDFYKCSLGAKVAILRPKDPNCEIDLMCNSPADTLDMIWRLCDEDLVKFSNNLKSKLAV